MRSLNQQLPKSWVLYEQESILRSAVNSSITNHKLNFVFAAVRKNRTCMVAILYVGTLPRMSLYASFFGKRWTWCRFVDTLHYTMKLIKLFSASVFSLSIPLERLVEHTILLFHLLDVQLHLCFIIQTSHLLRPLFLFFPTQIRSWS